MRVDPIWQEALHRGYPESVPAVPTPQPAALPRTALTIAVCDIAAKHGVSRADIRGKSRAPKIVLARHESAYELRRQFGISWPLIGREICRHHVSAMYGAYKHATTNNLPQFTGDMQPKRTILWREYMSKYRKNNRARLSKYMSDWRKSARAKLEGVAT